MSEGAGGGPVERARDAVARGDWQQAFDLLMEADADLLLAPEDLAVLGEVAYAAGHLDVTIEAWSAPTRPACRLVTRSRRPARPFVWRCTCCSTLR